jgi:glutaminase
VSALVSEAHRRYRSALDGENSRVYPVLVRARRNLFGICVVATSGSVFTAGDADVEFPIRIVTVAPGKGGVGTFSPPLDQAGNSVRGQLATRSSSQRLGLDLFVSAPV